MAGEIWHAFDNAEILNAYVYRLTDSTIYDVGHTAFEAIGVWNDARAVECNITMTAVGDMHIANFPVVAAGLYAVMITVQTSAVADTPSSDDVLVAEGFMDWLGTEEATNTFVNDLIGTAQTDLDMITGIDGTTVSSASIAELVGIDGDTLKDLSDQLDGLVTDQNKVLNVFPWEEPKPQDKRRVET